eukprot:1159177-Pelagomonas_calceolata.AAC.12
MSGCFCAKLTEDTGRVSFIAQLQGTQYGGLCFFHALSSQLSKSRMKEDEKPQRLAFMSRKVSAQDKQSQSLAWMGRKESAHDKHPRDWLP